MKDGISILVVGLGWGLPPLGLQLSGIPVDDRIIELHIVLSGMLGVTIYQWGKRVLPQNLKLRLVDVYKWSDKSLLGTTLFLFTLSLLLSLLSVGIIALTNSWDSWIQITVGIMFCFILAHSLIRMLFDRMDDNSGF